MTDTRIDVKELNNKGRKGLYLLVSSKGKPGRYYKFNFGQAQIDATKVYYEDRYLNRRNTGSYARYIKAFSERSLGLKPQSRLPEHRKAEQYLAKIKKTGSILSQIKTGTKTVLINNILTVSDQELESKKVELLQDLILDKQLMSLLSKDHNFDKLKNRLDFRLVAEDEKGNSLFEATTHGKSIRDVREHIRKAFKNNTHVSKQKYRMLDYLQKLGWTGERTGEGEIARIKLYVTFRRG